MFGFPSLSSLGQTFSKGMANMGSGANALQNLPLSQKLMMGGQIIGGQADPLDMLGAISRLGRNPGGAGTEASKSGAVPMQMLGMNPGRMFGFGGRAPHQASAPPLGDTFPAPTAPPPGAVAPTPGPVDLGDLKLAPSGGTMSGGMGGASAMAPSLMSPDAMARLRQLAQGFFA